MGQGGDNVNGRALRAERDAGLLDQVDQLRREWR